MFSTATIGALGSSIELADATGYRVASVPTDVDPLALVRAGSRLFSFAGYFGRPGVDEVGGLGIAWRSDVAAEEDRFSLVSGALAALGIDARAFVGFSYRPERGVGPEWDGFPLATAVVPIISVLYGPDGGQLVVVVPPGRSWGPVAEVLASLSVPGPPATARTADLTIESRPAPAEWETSVEHAVDSIKAGAFEKVVMARSVLVSSNVAYWPFDLVERLRSAYPACFVFGWQEGEATFVGASPELLIERNGRAVRSHPLAGSAPRGGNEEEDMAFGERLMASAKDRTEHRFVVEDIADRLDALTESLQVDRVPSLRKTNHVQHLSSELRGELIEQRHVFDLAGTLHPTPAVGGSPRSDAATFMAKEEQIDRGWYAGGIGWATPDGDGELAIALRCALIRGRTAWLFAGAGIVEDSVPSLELEETRLKFRTMMGLLAEA